MIAPVCPEEAEPWVLVGVSTATSGPTVLSLAGVCDELSGVSGPRSSGAFGQSVASRLSTVMTLGREVMAVVRRKSHLLCQNWVAYFT